VYFNVVVVAMPATTDDLSLLDSTSPDAVDCAAAGPSVPPLLMVGTCVVKHWCTKAMVNGECVAAGRLEYWREHRHRWRVTKDLAGTWI
jgi:hypothetical protein